MNIQKKLAVLSLLLTGVLAVTTSATASAAALPAAGQNFAINGQAACEDAACIIDRYVNPGIALLSATVAVIIVISIVVAGIQYSAAGGDPSKVGAAKSRIGKSLAALFFFFFLYAFLNYIVPGGVGK